MLCLLCVVVVIIVVVVVCVDGCSQDHCTPRRCCLARPLATIAIATSRRDVVCSVLLFVFGLCLCCCFVVVVRRSRCHCTPRRYCLARPLATIAIATSRRDVVLFPPPCFNGLFLFLLYFVLFSCCCCFAMCSQHQYIPPLLPCPPARQDSRHNHVSP